VLVDGLLVLKLTLHQVLGTPVAGRQLSGHGALQGSCARFMSGTRHEPLSPPSTRLHRVDERVIIKHHPW